MAASILWVYQTVLLAVLDLLHIGVGNEISFNSLGVVSSKIGRAFYGSQHYQFGVVIPVYAEIVHLCTILQQSRTLAAHEFRGRYFLANVSDYERQCHMFLKVELFGSDTWKDCFRCYHSSGNNAYFLQCVSLLTAQQLCNTATSRSRRSNTEGKQVDLLIEDNVVAVLEAAISNAVRLNGIDTALEQGHHDMTNTFLRFMQVEQIKNDFQSVRLFVERLLDDNQTALAVLKNSSAPSKARQLLEEAKITNDSASRISGPQLIEVSWYGWTQLLIKFHLVLYFPEQLSNIYLVEIVPFSLPNSTVLQPPPLPSNKWAISSEGNYFTQLQPDHVNQAALDTVFLNDLLIPFSSPNHYPCLQSVVNKDIEKYCFLSATKLPHVNDVYTALGQYYFPLAVRLDQKCQNGYHKRLIVGPNALLKPNGCCQYRIGFMFLPQRHCLKNKPTVYFKASEVLFPNLSDTSSKSDVKEWVINGETVRLEQTSLERLAKLKEDTRKIREYMRERSEQTDGLHFDFNFDFGLENIFTWLQIGLYVFIVALCLFCGYIFCRPCFYAVRKTCPSKKRPKRNNNPYYV